MSERHISENELVSYVNKKILDDNILAIIKKHLEIEKCPTCLKKYNTLINFNKILDNIGTSEEINEEINEEIKICLYTGKIKDFLANKLDEKRKDKFYLHLNKCEDCRELLVIMYDIKETIF